MNPILLNLVIDVGCTFEAVVLIFSLDGDPFDLTGWTALAQVRSTVDSSTIILNLAPTITDAVAGEVSLDSFTDEETFAMAPTKLGSHKWDIVLQNPGGERFGPFVAGTFRITNIATHHP